MSRDRLILGATRKLSQQNHVSDQFRNGKRACRHQFPNRRLSGSNRASPAQPLVHNIGRGICRDLENTGLMRRNETVHCETEYTMCLNSVQSGPPQPILSISCKPFRSKPAYFTLILPRANSFSIIAATALCAVVVAMILSFAFSSSERGMVIGLNICLRCSQNRS